MWLLVTVLAPMAIVVTGRVVERVRFGPESRGTSDTTTIRQKVQEQYRALFDELSLAAEAAAYRPDLVRTAGEPASDVALFALAASTVSRLHNPAERTALTIYNGAGEPVAWAGRPSDRPGVPNLSPGFAAIGGPFGVRLVCVAGIVDHGMRIGTVVTEQVLATAAGFSTRFIPEFDFTVSAAGLPVSVSYFTGDTQQPQSTAPDVSAFLIRDPSGRALARIAVPARAVEPRRQEVRLLIRTFAIATGLFGLVGLVVTLTFAIAASSRRRIGLIFAAAPGIWVIRVVTLWATAPLRTRELAFFNPAVYSSARGGGLLGSPTDFLLTGCAAFATALAAAALSESVRRTYRDRRITLSHSIDGVVLYTIIQLATALLGVAILIGYHRFIADTVANSTVDLLHYSFHPWSAARLVLQIGFIAFHAAIAVLLVVAFRVGLWVVRRPVPRQSWLPAQLLIWIAAVAMAQGLMLRRLPIPLWAAIAVFSVTAVVGYYADRLTLRVRRRSATVRLVLVFLVLLVPSLLFYFPTSDYSEENQRRLVESQPAQQVLRHREHHMSALLQALKQIDALGVGAPSQNAGTPEDVAFRLWVQTDLAALRLTSAVEIYDEAGMLRSRFALNLPSYRQQQALSMTDPTWQLAEDAVPFASRTQQVMSGSRAVYAAGRRVGAIAVRVAHDYDTLPFLSSHNPYFEVFRPMPAEQEGAVMHDAELAVYDWQRRLVYASTRPAWTVGEDLFQRIRRAGRPFWTTLSRSMVRDHVFVFSDREQIYLLGYPHKASWESLLDISELVVLLGTVYLAGVLVLTLFAWAADRQAIWPMRVAGEVRASFYGKLLLAFVVASAVPMVVLSFSVHTQFEAHVRAEEETEARAHVTVARRVVEDYETSARTGRFDDDDVMVWIRSVVGQDVNVFGGGRLLATSQRELFAAGLLPTLAPAPVYQTIALDRAGEYVGNERVGSFAYMLAAAPIRFAGRDGIVTVPLALRQRDIESKIDALDRGLVLLTLWFVLGAATLGYWMAERFAAPLARLTRATGRLASGDFEVLPVRTPGDEIQRLTGAFNRMAADLKAQRERLAHTTRIEASAEMARRVAHDLKNPLTPVQLSAEHLLRVAVDEGQASRSVVERCVDNILRQVRTLRQIASEFSTFGTAPVPAPESWDVLELLEEIAASYRSGLDGRIELVASAPRDLPHAFADRVLVARALTNLVENALHAMPNRGQILLRGLVAGTQRVTIEVIDTGSGIQPEVLPRIFEPYFSTRTGGTGLGMAIVKRNIEANSGTIEVTSTPGVGTCVRVVLPAARQG